MIGPIQDLTGHSGHARSNPVRGPGAATWVSRGMHCLSDLGEAREGVSLLQQMGVSTASSIDHFMVCHLFSLLISVGKNWEGDMSALGSCIHVYVEPDMSQNGRP